MLGSVHMGLKSLEINQCNLRCREHGNSRHTPSHKIPSVTWVPSYMATFFGDETWDLC